MELAITNERICPICKTSVIYTNVTPSNWKKTLRNNAPCKSCSNSLKVGGKGAVRPINGVKACIKCNVKLPVSEFYQYKTGRIHSFCNTCKKQTSNKYQKLIYRFAKYGITKDQYDKIYSSQGGKCGCCNEMYKTLVIDHNHTTQTVRGLLCRNCNLVLGSVKDDINLLNRMALYLEKFND